MKIQSNKVIALINSTHPIPCLAVALFSALFSVGSGLSLDKSLLIFFAVLLQQISVGLSNDWIDYKRDKAAERIDKPTVSGLVKVSELRFFSLSAALLALVVSSILSIESGLLMILMLAIGWAYNLGMKLNWSSAIPYALGFGSIPIFVGISATVPFWVELWVVVVAALLGVSAHFANVLPDMFEDKLTGVNALPHILGQRASAAVIALTAIIATLLVVTQSTSLPQSMAVIGLVLTSVLVGFASILSLRPKPPRVVFPLLIVASFVNVILLMLGVSR